MTPIFYEHNGGIAQLARASALQAEGQGFESPYLQKKNTERCFFFLILRVLCDYLQVYQCNDIIFLINEEENSYCVNC